MYGDLKAILDGNGKGAFSIASCYVLIIAECACKGRGDKQIKMALRGSLCKSPVRTRRFLNQKLSIKKENNHNLNDGSANSSTRFEESDSNHRNEPITRDPEDKQTGFFPYRPLDLIVHNE